MTMLEAIEKRYSRRSYTKTPISSENLEILNEVIQKYNLESGLSIQVIENGGNLFHGIRKSYGMFHDVRSFIILAGKSDDVNLKEKAGYYGELLALIATSLGLGTCFVGATFDKKNCPVKKDEALVCVITVGNVETSQGFKEKTIYRLVHRGTKKLEELYRSDEPLPDWFLKGMKAVQKAPSAVNRQPVTISYQKGMISAYVNQTDELNLVDLGIAKANFEIAAGGHFELGNHGIFHKD